MESVELNAHNKEEHPPMHTVEHLLNGLLSRKLGCPRAFSTHIEKKKSKIDLRYTRNLSAGELAEIENEVNDILAQDVSVTSEYVTANEARENYDLYRLPEGADTVRIVHIGPFDACPCIGKHVDNLREINGKLKIISSDFNEETEVLRVRFRIAAQ